MDMQWPVETRGMYSAADVAVRTGLPIPKVRYYACLYGDFLGAVRGPLDEWRFRHEHLPFFHALAQGFSPAAALHAAGPSAPVPLPGDPSNSTPRSVNAQAAPPPAVPASPSGGTAPPAGEAPSPSAGAPSPPGETSPAARGAAAGPDLSTGRPAQSSVRSPSDLVERLDELCWQVQDLLEETKQVQILLSRAIGLLEDLGAAAVATAPAPPLTGHHGTPGSGRVLAEGNDEGIHPPPLATGTLPAGAGFPPAGTRLTEGSLASTGRPPAAAPVTDGHPSRAGGTAHPAGGGAGRGLGQGAVPPAVIREATLDDDAMRVWEPQAF